MRSLTAALGLNAAFDTGRIVSGWVTLGPKDNAPERAKIFFEDLRDRLGRNGAIRSASVRVFRGGMSGAQFFNVDGEPRALPSMARAYSIDDRYFATLGAPILQGRDFTPDDRRTSPAVAIVSVALARVIARGGNALGHRIPAPGERSALFEVVGVVPELVAPNGNEPLVMYRPLAQDGFVGRAEVFLHAADDLSRAIHEAVSTVRAMDPALELPRFLTVDEAVMLQMGSQRFGATVLSALGAIAGLLTLFGMYVLAESTVAERRREFGVRAALGATRGQLSAVVVSANVRMVVLGVSAGLVLAWFGATLIGAFLYRVEPFDLPTLGAVIGLLFVLAMVVTLRPALAASRLDLAKLLKDS
ncbi:MAG TPA: FtsX-like permease family protein [Vicinamibacterales bacterium]|nr:FtsX-like permease family protein [Vicinamibacterales bacterium]